MKREFLDRTKDYTQKFSLPLSMTRSNLEPAAKKVRIAPIKRAHNRAAYVLPNTIAKCGAERLQDTTARFSILQFIIGGLTSSAGGTCHFSRCIIILAA
ncbi:hypothetical protein Q8A64_00780 [Oxalobacteraceae bacterium R-40]|uniref:Uncharacterized protein n=1 Tax=Keguizhuia sedimenti TaxID=3064264 RepID=A0ABU1BIV5_9BURK|nr:hypothetical protein [Oxalobacteraceae bacterium R-40]